MQTLVLKLISLGTYTHAFEYCYHTIAKNNSLTNAIDGSQSEWANVKFGRDSYYKSKDPKLQSYKELTEFKAKYKLWDVKIIYPVINPRKRLVTMLKRYLKNNKEEGIENLYRHEHIENIIFDWLDKDDSDYNYVINFSNFNLIYNVLHKLYDFTDVIFFDGNTVLNNHSVLVNRLGLSKYNIDWKEDVLDKNDRIEYAFLKDQKYLDAIRHYTNYFYSTELGENVLVNYNTIKRLTLE